MTYTDQTHAGQQIQSYLSSLSSHLAPISLADREEILREIGAHIRDSVEDSGTPVETVLARLGPPDQLAADYRNGLLVHRASQSVSPYLLLRATLRLASKGLLGFIVFLGGFAGYTTGISLFLMGVLKPFIPKYVGLWVHKSNTVWNDGTSFGIQTNHPAHEILGWWAMPVGIIGGAVVLTVTTLAIRVFLKASRHLQTRLEGVQYAKIEA